MTATSCRQRIEQLMTEDVIVARVADMAAANGYDYSAMLEMMVVALAENRAQLTDQLKRAYDKLITFGIIAAVIGWGVIEFVAWVVSNVSFSWGG
jgi:hypothetical protein